MTKKLYIDTNVILDAVEGRKNKFGKDIGNTAADLFLKALSCKYRLIVSDWTLEELSGLGKLDSTRMFFQIVQNKLIKAGYSNKEMNESKVRSKENHDDALHIVIAERECADYIVTRNTSHFREIGSAIPIEPPERLV